MYDTQFVCTYIFHDKSLAIHNPMAKKYFEDAMTDYDDDDDDEDTMMSEYLYKNELMYAFGLKDYNDKTINYIISELYKKMTIKFESMNPVYVQKFNECIQSLSGKMLSEDPFVGFTLLFSYHYFHMTHLCLCDIFNQGEFNKNNVDALTAMIKTKE